MDPLQLARWGAAACSGGLTQRSAAKLAGISHRHLQRLLAEHSTDPFVSRDLQMAKALQWEDQAAAVLSEATSKAVNWLRRCESEGADVREVAAALGATIQSAHRLAEAGARRAKRLQPPAALQPGQTSIESLVAAIATGLEAVKQLPDAEQHNGMAVLRQQLQLAGGQADGQVVDVQAIA